MGIVIKISELSKSRQQIRSFLPKIKKINRVIFPDEIISSIDLSLAKWLSNHFGFSLPFILKSFFSPQIKFHLEDYKLKTTYKYSSVWLSEMKSDVLRNKKVLVTVPEKSFIEEANSLFKKFHSNVYYFIPPLNNRKIENLKSFLKEKELILIVPKNSVFSFIDFFEILIVYREGSFFYYDSFKNIWFDYREILRKVATIKRRTVIFFDNFPSFNLIKDKSIKLKFNFKIINNLDEVLSLLKSYKKVIIFLPQKAKGKGLICQNCFYSLKCNRCQSDLIIEQNKIYCPLCLRESKIDLEKCPECYQHNTFYIKKIGAEAIYDLLKKLPTVYLIKRKTIKELRKIKGKDEFVIIGSLSLVSGLTPSCDALFFLNFENFYLSPDPFLKERYLRLINFFQEKTNNIFLVTSLRNPLIEKELKEGKIIERLLNDRKILKAPPYVDIIKIIKGSKDFTKLQKEFLDLKEKLKSQIDEEVFGPLLGKPFRVKNKNFLELIIRTNNQNFNLKKVISLIEFQPEKIKINPPEL